MSNGVFNFNFLALVFSEILGGPKFTLGGPMPSGRPYRNFFPQSEYFTISIVDCKVARNNMMMMMMMDSIVVRGVLPPTMGGIEINPPTHI